MTVRAEIVELFKTTLSDDARATLGEELEAKLSRFLAEAKAAHPDLFEERALVEYLALRLPGHLDVASEVSRTQAGDLLLASACVRGDEVAIARFEHDFLPLTIAAAKKLSMSDEAADELCQQVRMKLLVPGAEGAAPKIGNYAGSGALRSWVYATALRTGLNELRRIGRAPVPAGDEQLLVAMPDRSDDQELQYMKELYRTAFKKAFRGAIAELEVRLANVLRHYYLDDMTLEQIGKLYRVHKTTVMRWVNRAHAELENATKQHMVSQLELRPSEVESVLRLIQSGIQVGLASVLAPQDSGDKD